MIFLLAPGAPAGVLACLIAIPTLLGAGGGKPVYFLFFAQVHLLLFFFCNVCISLFFFARCPLLHSIVLI